MPQVYKRRQKQKCRLPINTWPNRLQQKNVKPIAVLYGKSLQIWLVTCNVVYKIHRFPMWRIWHEPNLIHHVFKWAYQKFPGISDIANLSIDSLHHRNNFTNTHFIRNCNGTFSCGYRSIRFKFLVQTAESRAYMWWRLINYYYSRQLRFLILPYSLLFSFFHAALIQISIYNVRKLFRLVLHNAYRIMYE